MSQYALRTVGFLVNNPAILQMTLFSIQADMAAPRLPVEEKWPSGARRINVS
jgi:hypothetical protein